MTHVLRFVTVLLALTLVALLLSAGCTSKSGGEGTPLQGARESLPATRPTLPGTAPTVPPTLYQDIEDVKDTLYSLSQEWEATGLTCGSNTCSGGFVDTAGNTLAIRATLYPDIETAHAAYGAEKQKGIIYRQLAAPEAGDESYAWQHLVTAELGVRKSNVVALYEYVAAAGVVSASQVRDIATKAMAGL